MLHRSGLYLVVTPYKGPIEIGGLFDLTTGIHFHTPLNDLMEAGEIHGLPTQSASFHPNTDYQELDDYTNEAVLIGPFRLWSQTRFLSLHIHSAGVPKSWVRRFEYTDEDDF